MKDDSQPSSPSSSCDSESSGDLNLDTCLFDATDMDTLSINEHRRYFSNSKTIGHALIGADPATGEAFAAQCDLPSSANPSTPEVRRLHHFERFTQAEQTRYRAQSPGGRTYYASRVHSLSLDDQTLSLACFSPPPANRNMPFWGSGETEVPIWADPACHSVSAQYKGGDWIQIDPDSVLFRESHKSRGPDQNQVMGQSAMLATRDFLEEAGDELNPQVKKRLEQSTAAPLNSSMAGQFRPEWLHLHARSLCHQDTNPQTPSNLGAAPKFVNTQMMFLERQAKWFALEHPEMTIHSHTRFDLIEDTDLIQSIDQQLKIEWNGHRVHYAEKLCPFQSHPIFPKASDLAQATGIAESLLYNGLPLDREPIVSESPVLENTLMPSKSLSSRKRSIETKVSSSIPTQITDSFPEKAIIKIYSTFQEANYEEPWITPPPEKCTGSGFVIKEKESHFVITNAHVVSDGKRIQVKIANQDKKFKATPLKVCYQSDLAILAIDDPNFQSSVEPVNLGEMLQLQDRVKTVGFPMGGKEVCVTKGIVSRIEVSRYAMGNVDMLQVQVDSAINPGNSGGPVFSQGKVVGVAFQGLSDGDNMGYIIPVPILQHFLQEVFHASVYHGFPELPISVQHLDNPYLRQFLKVPAEHTGVRITKIDTLSDCHQKLAIDDVILSIDGYPLSNEGTVTIPHIGKRIHYSHLSHMKFIGDTVTMQICRQGVIHELEVSLDQIPYASKRIGPYQYDKRPSYYFASGVLFQPLTRNYLYSASGQQIPDYVIPGLGSLSSTPKKQPHESFVFINRVLDCEENEGYQVYQGDLVKKVNGHRIHCLEDLINAFESCDQDIHLIELLSSSSFALKNMDPSEHQALLSHYGIKQDRSDDLLMLAAETKAVQAIVSEPKDKPEAQKRKPLVLFSHSKKRKPLHNTAEEASQVTKIAKTRPF